MAKVTAGTVFFVVLFCMTLLPVLWDGCRLTRVQNERSYYLLARSCEEETAASVSGQVYLSGGAGYLMKRGDEPFVVLACYLKESDCDLVARALKGKGVVAEKVKLEGENFDLRGNKGVYAQTIEDNLNTVDTVVRMLFDLANGLEQSSLGQEEARATLRGVGTVLEGLQTGNAGSVFEKWNGVLASARRKGAEIASGIVFCKDIRYLQVQLVAAIVNAKALF